jgi:hypothetical protein
MYTGTLIEELMATVERAEKLVEHKRVIEETERRQLFELPNWKTKEERIYAGAA